MEVKYDTSFFWLKRLKVLIGVFPLSAYLVFYFFLLSFVFSGQSNFNEAMNFYYRLPLINLFESIVVAIPLLLYIMMGLVIAYRSSANIVSYPYFNNWIYFLQRVIGLVALLFVFFHVWSMRIAPAILHQNITYDLVKNYLNPSGIKIFYVIGTAAVIFYLSVDSRTALWTFGITQGRKSQFAASIISWLIAIFMWVWALRILIAFA